MKEYKYSIGIDLGTTNCAVSYVDLSSPDGESQVFLVPQLDSLNTLVELKSLPSFLYLLHGHEAKEVEGQALGTVEDWAVGEFSRKQTSVAPGRVAHSAKSWLGHHLESPDRRMLPWDSDAVGEEEKVSPLEASAMLLSYIRFVWDARFAGEGAAFVDQSITVTVPASFDVAAQQATIEAALRAGYPDTVRLLEEPQAAFYRWMERGDVVPEVDGSSIRSVLVVDIGGGTSDFSFFRLKQGKGDPVFERIAVSEHILLGGDNMDLALAHAVESVLDKKDDEELSGEQWRHLIVRARELKERCLGGKSEESASLRVAIPGTGSGLFEGTLVAEIEAEMAREMLVEGFFPDCPATARPDAPKRGLQEWGLPYAADFAVTRYLADFVRELGKVDAVLFNGGTLSSSVLKERLLDQLKEWQGGDTPEVLVNEETDLAVARGAAYSGALTIRKQHRIEAGASRAIFLEIGSSSEEDSNRLLCVLPKGAIAGEKFVIELGGLKLMVNQLARFQTYQASNDCESEAGESQRYDAVRFTQLPLLETKIELPSAEADLDGGLPVRLESCLNELGLLELHCVSRTPGVEKSWPLHFSLRGVTESSQGRVRANDEGLVVVTDPGVAESRIRNAEANLKGLVKRGGAGRTGFSASRILKVLERELAQPKHEWNLILCRRLAVCLLDAIDVREHSVEHSEVWTYLTGYLMRPGFGDANDEQRMALLWDRIGEVPSSESRGVEMQEHILWRRLAGGLSQEWQETLCDRELALLDSKKGATAERIRMLGSLERLTEIRKGKVISKLLDLLDTAYREEGYMGSLLAALGSLLSRSLFRAGPEYVVSPAWVDNAWERMAKWDWKEERLRDVQPMFMQAARVVEEGRLNVSPRVRKKIFSKLKKSGVPETKLAHLQNFVPMTRAEQVSVYGEALPAGLVV